MRHCDSQGEEAIFTVVDYFAAKKLLVMRRGQLKFW